ncbi:uncharacterized protein LDX57_010298 [Aspergillus melleus]|uniref:uncharacterized protein n=1 Tax=Aspergillus melleus TaxID=138277 RepID=UPI001E8D2F65|nr:uncharacterized protein LDX57_010298 [Aspergillus melleus]KAH8432671.1 hypothetical protein LDX57_010298 [Aspergillus melleus]
MPFSWIESLQADRQQVKKEKEFDPYDVKLNPKAQSLGRDGSVQTKDIANNTFGDHTYLHVGDVVSLGQSMRADLRVTDPRLDMTRIQETNGGLIKEASAWILETEEFLSWSHHEGPSTLWISGDAGKGKTMQVINIIEHLLQNGGMASDVGDFFPSQSVFYFFCDGTDPQLATGTAVLRGLVFLMLAQGIHLSEVFQQKYSHAGKALFEDRNAFYALADMLREILARPNYERMVLVVDGLDQCSTGRRQLLDLIARTQSDRVKWVISSRHKPDIDDRLSSAPGLFRYDLETNAAQITTAVQKYIERRVARLVQSQAYDRTAHLTVHEHLQGRADGTFLWAAAVCNALEDAPRRRMATVLNRFPPALESIYARMWNEVKTLPEPEDAEICTRMLTSLVAARRPLRLTELASSAAVPTEYARDPQVLRELAQLCGSFLTLQGDVVSFVHHTAKEYLSRKVMGSGENRGHAAMSSNALPYVSDSGRRKVYA